MLFNSFEYLLFLPIVFVLYWFVTNRSLRLQNIMLLAASYFFYSCWDYRFLFLLIFSTLLDYGSGIKMASAKSVAEKKFWFWLSVIVNVGVLAVFKYYNFFIESFASGLPAVGVATNMWTLQLILPIGISFYTFHGLSYVIDIYNDKISPEKDIVDYSLFVSFFPLLVAGPIERATHLLPQIKRKRIFNYENAADGLRQILWGLFKKVVIADNCALYVNMVFGSSDEFSSGAHVIAAVLFTIQIYCDFSGYSDIAIGTARLFGIDLLRNFAYPFFSRDIAEFWRRWHISLTTWFRDYLYIPLGGSRGGMWKKISNTFIIFLISGFWHGANWTFVVWGALNALYIMPSIILNTNRNHLDVVARDKVLPSLTEFFQMLLTFVLTVIAFIFFRSESVTEAFNFILRIFVESNFALPYWPKIYIPFLLVFFIVMEWRNRTQCHALESIGFSWPKAVRNSFYYFIVLLIFMFAGEGKEFIYFQF